MTVQNTRIYLDYNATAPVLPGVASAVISALELKGNASSVHAEGRAKRSTIEKARDSVSRLTGSLSSSVTFTSGGTEANTTIVQGLLKSGFISSVLCSSVEHPSVLEHVSVDSRVAVSANGALDLHALEHAIKDHTDPFLFCLMLANNETGVIQPVKEAAAIVHDHGGLLFCDAVQGPGKIHLDFNSLGADFYSISAHKIGGPQGVGCVVSNSNIDLSPVLIGGGQERMRRSGTENVSGIAGFGAAADLVVQMDDFRPIANLRDKLEEALIQVRPDAVVFGQEVSRIPNTTNVAIPGLSSERQVIKLDLSGFSVSAGSACSSGKVSASHVLLAMGVPTELAGSAIRISIGAKTSCDDLRAFVDAWADL
ncbi:MAG: cysteine desulfurase family protein [Rhodospirillaceae bacterium]|nr:cysteine desulfurase family protein [Rhodospirillaceae bacterium]